MSTDQNHLATNERESTRIKTRTRSPQSTQRAQRNAEGIVAGEFAQERRHFEISTAEKSFNHSVTEPQPKTKTHHGGTETRRKAQRNQYRQGREKIVAAGEDFHG